MIKRHQSNINNLFSIKRVGTLSRNVHIHKTVIRVIPLLLSSCTPINESSQIKNLIKIRIRLNLPHTTVRLLDKI